LGRALVIAGLAADNRSKSGQCPITSAGDIQ
jgi:hypothetical protein